MTTRALSPILAFAVAVSCVGAVTIQPASGDTPPPASYVALGDSYTSASGVFPIVSLICTRSAQNYPHVVADDLGLALQDVSCGGATVQDMTRPQFGIVAPQFAALDETTDVVTIGIGGNDNLLFAQSIVACGGLNLFNVYDIGAPCKNTFGSYFTDLIDSDAPNIARALEGIHDRSPNAEVFVIGYPRILPERGRCYPQIPLGTGDIAYLNGIQQHINTMLATQAAANGATFVDTWTASTGHDACKLPGVRWVEPVIPNLGENLATIHPNAAGQAATARAVEAAFATAGIG